jgi:hypothetical protein
MKILGGYTITMNCRSAISILRQHKLHSGPGYTRVRVGHRVKLSMSLGQSSRGPSSGTGLRGEHAPQLVTASSSSLASAKATNPRFTYTFGILWKQSWNPSDLSSFFSTSQSWTHAAQVWHTRNDGQITSSWDLVSTLQY